MYYSLAARGIEFDQLDWQRQHGIDTMAYSPLGLGELARHRALAELGAARGLTAAQIALAWAVRRPDVVAIPKSSNPDRLQQNLQAVDIKLSAADLARIDAAFPPPSRKQPLETV